MTKASLRTAVRAYNTNPTAAIATYGPVADWDVSAITDMSGLFYDLHNFNADISNWDTSSVTTMDYMFIGAWAFNQPLSFDTSKVTYMYRMFYWANSLSAANKLLIRCAWADTSAFASAGYGSSWGPGTCPEKFTDTASLKKAVQEYNTDPTAAIATYNGPIAHWDVSAITDMRELFRALQNFNADISNWDTSKVTTMKRMFREASAFNQALSFNTSKVTNMEAMFLDAIKFNQALSFDTSKVTTMYRMFFRASAFNQSLSFDTSKVTSMAAMFYDANSLSNANKLLIRCAWAGTSAFPYGSSWGPGSCSLN